jgi:ABC-type uncharacterized transport system auxiliary subunit
VKTILTAASTLLLLASCAPHKIQYYQLSAVSKPQTAQTAAAHTLLVGRIAAPLNLQDDRIHYREGANEVGAYEYHRWTDPPGIAVKDALIAALRDSGAFASVRETSASVQGDYTLRGRLRDFSEIDGAGIDTRVTLELELHDVKSGAVLWTRSITHDDNVSKSLRARGEGKGETKKVSDVVASLDRNLQQVIGEAVSSLGAWAAAHPKQ